ncbi:bifunctional fructose-2,6-bisphosphate 2-phosphatase/6-phosphofructo-2-kinase NDAI_0A03430 [Naumovozyma dairenensis CBS 421]|uniref:6-phosphofructo-2-kinase domain-containing protein n=1 Tax=Naumovozyma dairenensis (strain ATCC 10597 / BCRC 20456 / CBS 421 / NBRC 0211 / NRRL Y-12639) TaxID=1071378 RepID=G0W3W2_NAUDC|nr:hypothetical protein NDAI_0A03430 [Naumovozyma dairenensis CBS 421]CCD22500.1 hypothetical protein NDAI_0A03430 [Naumovozyma dairenensis CBS 421]
MTEQSNILSDDEELLNGLGSQLLTHPSSHPQYNNHMARLTKRWTQSSSPSSSSSNKKLQLPHPDTYKDAVHVPIDKDEYTSPGQLYATDSGKLFHAGKILIILVGLPATSKTLLSVAITRYTRWLGVRTQSFHISKYKRMNDDDGDDKNDNHRIPLDFQSASPKTPEGKKFKRDAINNVMNDMTKFFTETQGQLAIYDALNILKSDRKELNDHFSSKIGVKVVFIESIMNDIHLIKRNIEIAIQDTEYNQIDKDVAEIDYKKRLEINEPLYETMSSDEKVSYVKYINFGQQIHVINNEYGYLINKIVFFMMNLRDKKGRVYFARCGISDKDKYVDDELLNEEGLKYSKILTETLLKRLESISLHTTNKSEIDSDLPLVVWTAPRKRTFDSGKFFLEKGIPVRKRNQLKQMIPGVVADLSNEEIEKLYPMEYKESLKDPYHYRFPRAESYHDLAVRMESLLLELEHTNKNVLIIAHESTIRILYGYLMACSCVELPTLQFTRDNIIEVSFSPFCNKVTQVPIKM